MPTLYVQQLSGPGWQFKGDDNESDWVDFGSNRTEAPILSFVIGGTLTFTGVNQSSSSLGCTNVQPATPTFTSEGESGGFDYFTVEANCAGSSSGTGWFKVPTTVGIDVPTIS